MPDRAQIAAAQHMSVRRTEESTCIIFMRDPARIYNLVLRRGDRLDCVARTAVGDELPSALNLCGLAASVGSPIGKLDTDRTW
jgi:hypothetical protein